jgi:hypothetical protein
MRHVLERVNDEFQNVHNVRRSEGQVVLTPISVSLSLIQIGKNVWLNLRITREVAMFRGQAISFIVLYRGYDIEVSRAPSGWRVGVYPRSADLPILRRGEVCACDQDAAVIEAKRRVDGVLH